MKSGQFKKMWKARVMKEEKLKKCINYWVRESDRPHFLPKS